MSVPQTDIHDDAEALVASVAHRLLDRLATVQASGRRPQVVLTGGTIADRLHRRLASVGGDGRVDWSKVEFWWGDERFVPSDSDERNEGQARRALLDHLDVDPALVHPIPADGGDVAGDPEAAANAYAELVRASGGDRFDVTMLGVGPDGHCASLFPGFAQVQVDDAIAVAVHKSPKPPPTRVSLTMPALSRSDEVWFVVSGADKAEAVARALQPSAMTDVPPGDLVAEVPSAGPRGTQRTVWFLDREAARRLT